MRTTVLSLTCLLLAAGCSNPAPGTPARAEPAPAAPARTEPARTEPARVAAAEPARADEEEGCIYKDAHEKQPEEAGCPHGGGDAAAPDTGVPGHFGAAFALKDARPLATVLAAGKDVSKEPVQVSGTVDSVCQKKGCWLVMKDGEAQARILMKDHAFNVPMDSKGKPVVVEGTIEARNFTEAQVKHLEKDAGGDPAKVGGERTEFVLTATGLELKNS
jgi:hypothetical protein